MTMIHRIALLALLGNCMAWGQAAKEPAWLLPNFAYRLSVEVSNPGTAAITALATVPVLPAAAIAPGFPGKLAIVMIPDGLKTSGAVLPSQVDDLDGDGFPDQLEFPITLQPGQRRQVDIYYSTTLDDTIYYPKQVQAKHSYGFNRQTASLESELIGYRTYGGFFLDVQARMAGHPGLYNDLDGYLPAGGEFEVGRDMFHVGDTLGLGGFFLRRDGRTYAPPVNVADYQHKPIPEMVAHYRVVSQGPLRAIIESTLENWTIGDDVIRVKARYSIDGGEGFVRCRLEAIPVRVAAGHSYETGIGIRDLPKQVAKPAPGRLIVRGEQSARDGMLGLAVYFDPTQFPRQTAVRTPDGENQAGLFHQQLQAGQTVAWEYAMAAAWSRSGIASPEDYLERMSAAVAAHIGVGGYRFARTPNPERLDGEPGMLFGVGK